MELKNNSADWKQERYKSQILNALYNILKYESSDKTFKFVTFTDLRLSPDKSVATIFVDFYKRTEIDIIIAKLNASKGWFRTQLAGKLELRRTPALNFAKDETIERGIKMDELFAKLK